MASPNMQWLGDNYIDGSELSEGVSFGMPWPRGTYRPGQIFVIESGGREYALDSRELAYWADGSLKWTTHSVSGHIDCRGQYTVKGASWPEEPSDGIRVKHQGATYSLDTRRGLQVTFGPPGSSSLLTDLTINGQSVCSGATIIASIGGTGYTTRVDTVNFENATFSRVVVKASGVVLAAETDTHLPFDIQFYVYSDISSVKILHSVVHDLDLDAPPASLRLRFSVPFGKPSHLIVMFASVALAEEF